MTDTPIPTPNPDGPRRLWLIVEDEPALRMMLTSMLLLWNIEALVFEDGFAAMHWLDEVEAGDHSERLPELAMLDIRLPGPNGHEIAARMREVAPIADILIVMMTAYWFDADERKEIEALARPDLFIRKPLPDPLVLMERLHGLLDKRQKDG